ncbi:MAG: S-layer homology domain-containing protein [Patescibacteria group bacterium]|nr:S-layer homology domain-containing protein [Patescibacteria group bacterium]
MKKIVLIAFVLLIAGLPLSFADEVTYTCLDDNEDGVISVGTECLTIGEAIDNAEAGGIIEVADGTYYENLVIDKDLTVRSASGDPTLAVIDGGNSGRIFNISANATIQGLTVQNGYGEIGGGVYVYGGSLDAYNCIFDSNNSSNSGGAIAISSPGADSTINRAVFKNNSAAGDGGALYFSYLNAYGGTVKNSLFYDNTANGEGGAIYAGVYSFPTLYNNTFAHNEADESGGGVYIYADSANLQIINNIFYQNDSDPSGQSNGEGDGLYIKSYLLYGTVNYNNFYDNAETDIWVKDRAKSPITIGAQNVDQVPGFTSAATDDFSITAESYCKDSGTTLADVTEDLTGGVRPAGLGHDLGAYEYGSTVAVEEEEEIATEEEDYCTELGHTVSEGNCLFEDESSCSLEDFYTGVCGEEYSFCEMNGGDIEARLDDNAVYYSVCVFDNGSECDEADYFAGSCEEAIDIECTEEYAPVCGEVDGSYATYSNNCYASVAGAENVIEGECVAEVVCGDFPDINPEELNDEECLAVSWVQEEGIFTGNDDTGALEADSPINRAETTKVLLEAFGYAPNDGVNSLFPDVIAGSWYLEYVNAAADLGIVEGYPDGTFRPSATVNKVEMLKIVLETAGTDLSEVDISEEIFSDIAATESTEWYRPYVYFAYENDLIDVDGDEFDPDEEMMRKDVIMLLYRLNQI